MIRNTELMGAIQEIYDYNKGRYGVRRIHKELSNKGYHVNHKRVQRLMHEMRLFGKCPKEKYHSYKGEVGKIADNIINRDFSTTAPLQKWTTDVSQFSFSWGKCYISPILDMNTNEIISYDLSLNPNLEQIQRMLNKAFEKFPSVNGLIFHSVFSETSWGALRRVSQRSTAPRIPRSPTSRLEPLPSQSQGMFSALQKRNTAAAASACGISMSRSAGPPMRKVVAVAIEMPVVTRQFACSAYMARAFISIAVILSRRFL